MDYIEEEIGEICKIKRPTNEVNLDSFELKCVIGKGAYAKVLLVRKKDSQQLYALKVLKKKYLKRDVLLERNVMIEISHPFIMKLAYSFQNASHLYFCMEYCPGGEMYYLLSKQKHFSEQTAMFYAAQVLLALEYLHSRDIIYRDLKPENIVICADGFIKLTDFGLCKKGLSSDTQGASSICGTPEYMAPEMLMHKQYGKAIDWWAFGCLLYEMVVGRPPFYGNKRNELENQIFNSNPKMGSLSIRLQDLISRLLEKNPKQRLTTNIRNHQWFDIDFDSLLYKNVPVPYIPKLSNETDVACFDPQFIKSSFSDQGSGLEDQESYNDFTYRGSQEISLLQSFQTLSPEIIGEQEDKPVEKKIQKVHSTEMIYY